MFSSTTMASSTTMPMASTSPKSVMLFRLKAQRRHDREGADQGDRHVDHRQDHRPPVLQEDQHDDARPGCTASRRVLKTSPTDSRMYGVVS